MINMHKLSKAYIEHVHKLPTIYIPIKQFCNNTYSSLYYRYLKYDNIYAIYPYIHLESSYTKQSVPFTISKNIDKLFKSYPQINTFQYILPKYHSNPEQYVIEDVRYILVICYEHETITAINYTSTYYYMYIFDKNYHFLNFEMFSSDTLNNTLELDNKYYLKHIHDTTYNRIKSLVTVHML